VATADCRRLRAAALAELLGRREQEATTAPRSARLDDMVTPPPARAPAITKFLKPYILKMNFTNNFVSAQVIHTPSATVTCSASSQEKLLRPSMESTRDVAAAAKIGKLLGERLLV